MLIFIGFLILLYMFPASLAMSITKWAREPKVVNKKVKTKSGKIVRKPVKVQEELTVAERLTCCIPILSACKVWKALYDRYGWTKFAAILIPIGIVYRCVAVFFTDSAFLYISSFFVLWFSLALHQILYAVVYFITARMHNSGIVTQILCIVFPEFAAYLLASQVPRVLKEMWEDEENELVE